MYLESCIGVDATRKFDVEGTESKWDIKIQDDMTAYLSTHEKILNFDYNLVNKRISVYGYSFKDAISLPKHSKRKYIKENLLSKH